MSNEYQDWKYEQSLLTRQERVKEDLYYELSHSYKKDKINFIIDVLNIVNEMLSDKTLV